MALPENLQAVHFEDGSTAYVAQETADQLFASDGSIDPSALNLEQLQPVSFIY